MTVKAMGRKTGPESSIWASEWILRKLSELQRLVLKVVRREHQRTKAGVTDLEMEVLPEFKKYRPSTIRKRMTELRELGFIAWNGQKRNGANVSVPVPITELLEKESF